MGLSEKAFAIALILTAASCGKSDAPSSAISPAQSGGDSGSGWASSGGELLMNSQNPFWVKNTTVINYCIEVDTAGVSAPVDHIRAAVKYAIKYWQTEFARPVPYLSGVYVTDFSALFSQLGVGTQQFNEIPCGPGVDLAFQFGLGTLTKDQLAHIPNPRTYVGITERTSYDEVNLRGQGFIFIASDRGDGAYNGDATTQGNAWSNDVALYTIVMHELGHVFGIPHCGTELGLMSQQLPEALVSSYLRPFEVEQQGLLNGPDAYGNFFFPAVQNHMCTSGPVQTLDGSLSPWVPFFGLQPKENCVWFTLDPTTMSINVATSVDDTGSPLRPVGKISGATFSSEEVDPIITLRLNAQQTVFPDSMKVSLGPTSLPYLYGPYRFSIDGIGGSYASAIPGSPAIPVMMRITPGGFNLFATENGTTTNVITWQNSE